VCTWLDDSALKGYFFTNVGYSAFNSSLFKTMKDEKFVLNEHRTITTVLHDELHYLHGDFLPMCQRQSISNKSFIGGSNEFFLSNSNDAGLCNDFDAVKFGRQSYSECLTMIHNLKSECTTYFGIDRFTTGILGQFYYRQ